MTDLHLDAFLFPPSPPPMAEDCLVGDAVQFTGVLGDSRWVVVDRTPTPMGLHLEMVRVPDFPPPPELEQSIHTDPQPEAPE